MNKKRTNIFFRAASISVLSVCVFAYATTEKTMKSIDSGDSSIIKSQKKDSIASVEAFKKVYSVLMSPRCMNCHPSGDIPLQGDDSHIHNMLPERGVDGKGIATMQCATCHAGKGVPGENTPPGNPEWHLPPMNMKMVFQGKSARELALQLVDPKKNGNKDMKALRAHAEDGLVKGGWQMGGNRTLPPLSHAEFAKVWYTWIDNGAYAPAK